MSGREPEPRPGRRVLAPTMGGRVGFALLAFLTLAVSGAAAAALGLAAYLGGEWAWQALYDVEAPRLSPDVLEIVQAVPAEGLYLLFALAQWPVLAAAVVGAMGVLQLGRLSTVELLSAAILESVLFLHGCFALQTEAAAASRYWVPVLPSWSVPVCGSVLLTASLFAGGWLFRGFVARWGEPAL